METCITGGAIILTMLEGAGNGMVSLVVILACIWLLDRRFRPCDDKEKG